MKFDRYLTDPYAGFHDRFQDSIFRSLNVNLQQINMRVAIFFHKA